MIRFSIVITAIVLAANVSAQQKPLKGAAAALQGTWVITSINGQPADGSQQLTLTFAGDKYHQALNGEVNERGTVKLDVSKKPMTIDLIIAEGADAGKTQIGIIEVTGDTIRASLDAPGGQQRPADFTIKDSSLMFVGNKKKQ